MAIFASEFSAMQQSGLSLGVNPGTNRADPVQGQANIPASTVINSHVETADALKFMEAISGTVPVGSFDKAVDDQLKRLRQLQSVGEADDTHGSLGENVISSLRGVQDRLDNSYKNIEMQIIEHLKMDTMNPAQIVALQVKVSMFSFELEMANGIVHKSGQHIDTFLRSQ